jgi:hypothetical protein
MNASHMTATSSASVANPLADVAPTALPTQA